MFINIIINIKVLDFPFQMIRRYVVIMLANARLCRSIWVGYNIRSTVGIAKKTVRSIKTVALLKILESVKTVTKAVETVVLFEKL